MRSSRLVAILMELSRDSRTSVSRLAERHEVSTRTIQRDIAALHDLGVPVWTRTGPTGGVGLVEGWRSPLTGMSSSELRALVIGETASRDLGMQVDFEVARLKLLSVPTARDGEVEPARERFLVDKSRWFGSSDRPEALPAVARAVWSGRRLTICYERRGDDRATVSRLVDPLGLVLKGDNWYLVAAHGSHPRTYRLSRITGCVIHDEPSVRPSGFSLEEYWTRSREEFESSIHTLPVRLLIPEGSVEHLTSSVPGPGTRHAVDTARRYGGLLELDLTMEKHSIALAQLLGVPEVEVLEPAALRRDLHLRAAAIADRNRAGDPGSVVSPTSSG
ncbi:MAG: WYL domain-containing protein [Dietzia psychralcaliphila]